MKMLSALILVLLIPQASYAEGRLSLPWKIAWAACQIADASTTAYALEHYPTARETNPLLRPGGYAIRLSVNVFGILQVRRSNATIGQQRAMASGFIASGCGAATSNVIQMAHAR